MKFIEENLFENKLSLKEINSKRNFPSLKVAVVFRHTDTYNS